MINPTWSDIASAWSNTLCAIGDLATTEDLQITELGRDTFNHYLRMKGFTDV